MSAEYETTDAFWAPCDDCHAVKPVKWEGTPPARVLLCRPCSLARTAADFSSEFDRPTPLFVASLFLFLGGLGVGLGCVVHLVTR